MLLLGKSSTLNKVNAWPVWGQAFRPFFAGGALFASISLVIWLFALSGKITAVPVLGWYFWHGHEMLFGFGVAIIVGFVLTAVQNWTGIRGVNGAALIGLFSVWLMVRLLNFTSSAFSLELLMATTVLFWFLVLHSFIHPLLKQKKYRNLPIAGILVLLGTMDVISYWLMLVDSAHLITKVFELALHLIMLLVLIIGGRIIPLFTANATGQPAAKPIYLIEWVSVVPLLVAGLLLGMNVQNAKLAMAICYCAAALANGYRAFRWWNPSVLKQSMLWSLHVFYWMMVVSLCLFAVYYSAGVISKSLAIHSFAVGAMGGMILAMISRVSLGHSGRKITSNRMITLSFILVFGSALLRLAAGVTASNLLLISAGVFWSGAFLLFICGYWGILLSPRADGKPG